MGSFLLFILVIFLVFIGLIGGFVFRFIRLFKKQTNNSSQTRSTNTRSQNQQHHNNQNDSNQDKIFSKEEGEYIDYEEIK